ncbi:hypothetical protein BH10ACT1_BH10ACT1_00580 [soil metagenome]
MSDLVLLSYVVAHGLATKTLRRVRQDERGEGVISAAIAVLVMAFLGVAMWVAFKTLFANTTAKTGEQVDQIGS